MPAMGIPHPYSLRSTDLLSKKTDAYGASLVLVPSMPWTALSEPAIRRVCWRLENSARHRLGSGLASRLLCEVPPNRMALGRNLSWARTYRHGKKPFKREE